MLRVRDHDAVNGVRCSRHAQVFARGHATPLVQGVPVDVPPATDEALLRAIGLSALAFQQTNTLDLSCSGLGGIGETVSILPQLAAALQIKGTPLLSLDISGNRLVDDDVALLVRGLGATCPALAVLNISGPAVQTGGFAQKLGGATAAALAAVLPSLPCLTTLRLAHNGIGEEGGRVLAEAAGKAPALREVDLYGNDIGEAAAATLVSHLRGRTGADTCGGRVFAALQASDGLLNLKGGQGGTDMGGGATAADLWLVAASVRVAPTAVQRLDVSTNPLSDAAVGQLALALSEGPGGGGVLLTLSLNRCGLVELDPFAKGVAAGGWASLATLSLGGNRLADAAAVSLAGLLPRLPALQFLHAYSTRTKSATPARRRWRGAFSRTACACVSCGSIRTASATPASRRLARASPPRPAPRRSMSSGSQATASPSGRGRHVSRRRRRSRRSRPLARPRRLRLSIK